MNGFIIAVNPNSQLTCLNNLLSRVSVLPDFSPENTISSNHAVAGGFSLLSDANHAPDPSFDTTCKWGGEGIFGKSKKERR